MRHRIRAQWVKESCDRLRREAGATGCAETQYGRNALRTGWDYRIVVTAFMEGSMVRYTHELRTENGKVLITMRDRSRFAAAAADQINADYAARDAA